jgi:hypothetical protein
MAINRIEYPITYDEVITFLLSNADEILRENREKFVCGDTRPELLYWAASRLQEQKTFVTAGKSGV